MPLDLEAQARRAARPCARRAARSRPAGCRRAPSRARRGTASAGRAARRDSPRSRGRGTAASARLSGGRFELLDEAQEDARRQLGILGRDRFGGLWLMPPSQRTNSMPMSTSRRSPCRRGRRRTAAGAPASLRPRSRARSAPAATARRPRSPSCVARMSTFDVAARADRRDGAAMSAAAAGAARPRGARMSIVNRDLAGDHVGRARRRLERPDGADEVGLAARSALRSPARIPRPRRARRGAAPSARCPHGPPFLRSRRRSGWRR